MRILLASDIHTDLDACDALVAKADAADLAIIAGDLATRHEQLAETVMALAPMTAPAILVPGNNETPDALRAALDDYWPSATLLHAAGTIIQGQRIFGLGGGIPPIDQPWSYDLDEDKADSLLAACDGGDILVTHAPPKGHADRFDDAHHIGSPAILAATERLAPKLHAFGHVHSCWEQQSTLGPTTLINAGPRGVWFELTR